MNTQSNLRLDADALAALLAGWSGATHGNLAQKLTRAFRAAIDTGTIAGGTRLPAERTIAASLAVSRSTVTTALDELRNDGTLRSQRGSGTFVRDDRRRRPAGTRVAEHFMARPGIDLASGNPPDVSHLPAITLDTARMLVHGGSASLEPLGLASLRAALAERHNTQGQLTDPSQIHVTAGAHHAVALCIAATMETGRPVAVEEPSYPGIFDILEAHGTAPIPVRRDGAGIVPDDLERVLRQHRPTTLYCQTGPHNPTGRVPTPGRLRAVAEVLDRHDTVVIEDVALADLTFAGRPRPELAELCRKATVVSVGSFSKVAWGGLRVGWMRGPHHLIKRTGHMRLATDMGTSVPSQLLAQQLVPHLEGLAERRRATLANRVDLAVERLGVDLQDWSIDPPAGGSVLWVRLPIDNTAGFVLHARQYGVQVAPGSAANSTRAPDHFVRICVDRTEPAVEEGIRRLAQAWRVFEPVVPNVSG